MSAAPEARQPDPERIRAALRKQLGWRGLASSPRLSRFLETVVEWTLTGRASQLKESSIAVEVFDRDPTYDSRTDPIVRVQAVRLRSKMIEYYATAGAADEVVIELPPRGYVPLFRSKSIPVPPPAAAPPKASVAVLPFADMSPDQNLQYFCDGIAEEILHLLAQSPTLHVAARTSSFAYRSRPEDIRTIGQTLGVSTVLEGSVRIWQNRVRITAQLNRTDDGFHLWSETFDREFQDIFAIQDDIARLISTRLTAPDDQQPRPAARTAIDTWNLVLLGRHHFARQTPDAFAAALDCFQKAAAADPHYAPAWTGLGLTLVYQAFFGLAVPSTLAADAAAAAQQAVRLAPDSAEAHLLLGAVHAIFELRLHDSVAEYETALALDASSSQAHEFMALGLTCLGRDPEAVAFSQRARELDPLSARIEENLAFVHFQFRRYAESTAAYRQLLAREPFYPLAWLGLAWNALLQNDPSEALSHLGHLASFVGDWPFLLGTKGYALARAGRRDEARQLANSAPLQAPGMSYERALIATGLDQPEAAVHALQQARDERIGWMLFLATNPLLDALRAHPGFEALSEG